MRNLIFLAAIVLIAACAPKVASTGGGNGKYTEDLSALRSALPAARDTAKAAKEPVESINRDPSRYVEARHAINGTLDAVLDSIDRINLSEGVVDGFTIQIYSGTKREEALNVKKQIATTIPELETEVQYVQPNFRVRTGKYLTRLEAQKDYLAVKRYFPNAIVIPDRIYFRN